MPVLLCLSRSASWQRRSQAFKTCRAGEDGDARRLWRQARRANDSASEASLDTLPPAAAEASVLAHRNGISPI